ncbi:MAG: hypothetical protein WCK84_06575 [Bacteroidota bacterium]
MSPKDQIYFNALKKKIVAMMQQSYPGMNPSISEWKGQEITDFQEELLKQVNAHISEKWFYSHMKSKSKSLPRIDVLNLLSKYAGYVNWDDFVFKNHDLMEAVHSDDPPVAAAPRSLTDRSNRYFIIIPVATVFVLMIFFGLFKLFNTRDYRFSFYDADTKEPIKTSNIQVRLLLEGESPVNGMCDANGYFFLKTDKSLVRLVVSAPYYITDTIVRILKKLNNEEIVSLHANDYALMIHYFSQMKVDDWEKRRSLLEKMIDDGAMIYQVFGDKDAVGMELYNKQEFIDKLTVPSGSLRNIEILDSKFREEKISVLRFRIKEQSR